jgi:U3 small nucleolar RNA-associated protein 7
MVNQKEKHQKNDRKKSINTNTIDKTTEKYIRGNVNINLNKIKYKKLRATIKENQDNIIDSAKKTAATEVLLPSEAGIIESEGNEKTYKLRQEVLKNYVDLNTSKNMIDLQLPNFGPYRVDYTRNGRYLLFGGQRGHIAIMDSHTFIANAELQLQETIHDVHYLHNETMFAVAQHKYTYIYDNKGVEIHCLKDHERPYRLDFLPYHYLLTTIGHSGRIKWQDISMGKCVANYQTGHGPSNVLKHNNFNAVSHVGHSNGVVSLWSPAAGKALASIFCHKSPVNDLAIDREGRYMATAGMDGILKLWDLRKYTTLHQYKLDHPATSIDISDRGFISLSMGRNVQVLKDAFIQPTDTTYIKHSIRPPNPSLMSGSSSSSSKSLLSSIMTTCVKFRPYEDVLCIGHSHGLSTIVVPGAGEPNFDTFESNPFMNTKQRREAEVQSLLHKLDPTMITLDASFIGTIDKDQKSLQAEHNEIFSNANKSETSKKEKNKKRGRNKISAKLRRKQKNVIDAQTLKLQEKLKTEKEMRNNKDKDIESKKTVLDRFL